MKNSSVPISARRRNKPWSIRSPETRWDYLVIGSGMGGMVAAAMLAELGKKVLVLEQHYVPGGFTHMFRRPGYIWDVGVHAVGEVTTHSLTGRLLARLTQGQLEWASLGGVYDEFYFPDGFRIDFPNRPEQFRANLVDAFPAEEAAVDGYLAQVKRVAGAMKGYYLARAFPRRLARVADWTLARKARKYLGQRTGEVVAELTGNPRLRSVLTSQWGYYGSTPSRSSFAIQALVTKHFMWGGYYPVGGARRIARTLLGRVAAAGGWTRIKADVAEILVERGAARGVRLTSGEELRARRVISAAGVASTVRNLLPDEYREQPWAQSILGLPAAPAHVCLYLGFKGDIRQAGAGPANKWFYHTWSCEEDAWEVAAGDAPGSAPVLYCSFPSLKDPHHDPGPEERHTGEVVTFVPWQAFQKWRQGRWKRRGEDYESFKEALQAKLLEDFLAHMPQLRPLVDYAELSTPLSTDHFVRPSQGSIYGLEPTPERFRNPWLKPRSPVPGLFFAGSEVATVGVIGAMMGGVLAVLAAEPVGTARLLWQLRRGATAPLMPSHWA